VPASALDLSVSAPKQWAGQAWQRHLLIFEGSINVRLLVIHIIFVLVMVAGVIKSEDFVGLL
jgi:hypothetical protein